MQFTECVMVSGHFATSYTFKAFLACVQACLLFKADLQAILEHAIGFDNWAYMFVWMFVDRGRSV